MDISALTPGLIYRVRERDRADLIESLSCIVLNAVIGPDVQRQGHTDAYHVPLDDIDNARLLLARLDGKGE